MSVRIGHGFDVHRLVEGRALTLGGIGIPFDLGLEGHSDADVLLHAICDALLGAAGLGDIGLHFPDSDPAHQNRNSREFLRHVHALISERGYAVSNIDSTIVAQAPRLSGYVSSMEETIARDLGIAPEQVSVKATTTEGLDATGRGEGIAAHAVALISSQDSG